MTRGDEGKAAAAKVLERIKGGEDFAKVAGELSTDKLTRYRGGALGWRSAQALGYGTAVVEAVGKLKAGDVSDVVESTRGLHILRLDARIVRGAHLRAASSR